MGARNSADNFGWVSRLLHWGMAALILGQLWLGWCTAHIEPGLANLWLFGLHKTLGIVALLLVLIRLVWHRISPPPAPLGTAEAWTQRAARLAHRVIYAALIAIPLTGWVASSATGLDVLVFDRWALPAVAPVSETWENIGFLAHRLLGRALMAVLVLHVAGAVLRATKGDGTLRRMIRGRARG